MRTIRSMSKDILVDVGTRLRIRRNELGLNLADAGRASGVDPMTVSRIERGENMTLVKLVDYARGLGLRTVVRLTRERS